MTYSLFSKSRQDSDAVLLFHFVQGATNWRYTSCARNITYDSETWTATPIKISHITIDGKTEKNNIDIEFPRGHTFASQFIESTPEEITLVTIYRGNLSDPDEEYEIYWIGRIVGGSGIVAGKTISVNAEQIYTAQRRNGVRARCQILCRHALYGERCGLSELSFDTASTCTSALGNVLTITDASALSDGAYVGGMVEYDGIKKYIMAHTGTTIELFQKFKALNDEVESSGSASVTIYEGCRHTHAHCVTKNNKLNFGGFIAIPAINPFTSTTIL